MTKPDVAAKADAFCRVPLPMWMPTTLRRALSFINQADSAKGCDPFMPTTVEASTTDDGGATHTSISGGPAA